MHSHNIQRTVIDAGSRMGITPRDVILMYLPLFHVFGLYEGLLMSVATGARMVLTTVFEPGETLRLIAQEGATILNGFDTHFHALTGKRSTAAVSVLASLPPAWRAASPPPVAHNGCWVLQSQAGV